MTNDRRGGARTTVLRGRPLRYLLTVHLLDAQEQTVHELVAAVRSAGFELSGRPSKAVSDALRWEVARHRVVRLGRGRYGPGRVPRSTRYWIRQQVRSNLDPVPPDEPFPDDEPAPHEEFPRG